ncbi:uncharacterized protein MYCGRDRAFT_108218 [Zymoseptoria tritici IPO323]|uniref:Myb-like domain-containing protein n=1 Tax=Zymoseptoria tritici (strain CBS 115943 / IPO323) TaxID=336722 RepID=F9X4L6_ZYMTI|nr:uncharacterized protein MYCGRDRAFT_108218 [Zymoseptoria tritici IPO323]EGP90371.1 hypothetical protein MYCGRDRAFT_108218 [Zymoseptoria tritici IPO323]
MAPAVIIDLTSSPEPDDHLQKPSNLALFAPRKDGAPRKKSTDIWSSAEEQHVSTLNGTPKDLKRSTAAAIVTTPHDDEGYSTQNPSTDQALAGEVRDAVLGGLRNTTNGHRGLPTTHSRRPIDRREDVHHPKAGSGPSSRNNDAGALPGTATGHQGLSSHVRNRKADTTHTMAANSPFAHVQASTQQVAPPSSLYGLQTFVSETSNNSGSIDARKRRRTIVSPSRTASDAKRIKLERLLPGVPKRRKVQLNDVTNYAQEERISYSESPDIAPTEPVNETIAVAFPRSQRHVSDDLSRGPNMSGQRWTAQEDALILRLRTAQNFDWHEIVPRFNGRTSGALQVRFSTIRPRDQTARLRAADRLGSPGLGIPGRSQRVRKSHMPVGHKSWKEVSNKETSPDFPAPGANLERHLPTAQLQQDRAFPSSTSRILRQRELGCTSGRSWSCAARSVGDEVKENVHKGYSLRKHYHGTSGDAISLAWNPTGTRFAVGSIAISDSSSMQYNMPRNLVVGDHEQLLELADHHVPRPPIESTDNVNAQHSMRSSQDPRLFLSVTAAAFSRHDDTKLYTASADKTVRHYKVGTDGIEHQYVIKHPASVDLLTVGSNGLVASGCHKLSKNVLVFQCHGDRYEGKLGLSPQQADLHSTAAFPSALKWGEHSFHGNLLLAGYSGDEEKQHAGETCLWDVRTGQQLHLNAVTRNVFDVAWNPNASSASNAFAVACNSTGCNVGKGMRTVIQCFAPGQNGGRRTLTWECPALDINNVVFCPHDDNLIAAGATDGTVYVWDQRWANRSQKPLHVLAHGESINVLSHDRPRDITDTGVQFLSWGSTKSRLYTGSSDGVVKVWNPHRSEENAFLEDIAAPRQHRSAVMSGAFSPDYRELLIGTENGRINLFEIGGDSLPAQPFKLASAPNPKQSQDPLDAARGLLSSGAIELRPCGAMPFRQAVQGPKYAGPFLKPGPESYTKAEEQYAAALSAQTALSARKAQEYFGVASEMEDDEEMHKADLRVRAAQDLLHDLQMRSAYHRQCAPRAAELQQTLLHAETARRELLRRANTGAVEACELNCAVLPGERDIEDSSRSDLRIPGFLRWTMTANRDVDSEEAIAACSGCNPSVPLMRWTRKNDD